MASSRFVSSASPLIKLLHSNRSPTVATPFTIRTIRTVAHPATTSASDTKTKSGDKSKSDVRSKKRTFKSYPLQNPFLMRGIHIPYEEQEGNEAKYARLDMPGIGKKGLKLWVEKDMLWLDGIESKAEKVGLEYPRKFYGIIELPKGLYKYKGENIKAKLENGVLKVVIPKLILEDRKVTKTKSGDKSKLKKRIYKSSNLQNPFLKRGTHIPYEEEEDNEAKYARLDIPGIGKKELKLWVEKDVLWLRGVELEGEKVEINEYPRKFFGVIELPKGPYKVENIKAKLEKGVLKVVIPKLSLEVRKDAPWFKSTKLRSAVVIIPYLLLVSVPFILFFFHFLVGA